MSASHSDKKGNMLHHSMIRVYYSTYVKYHPLFKKSTENETQVFLDSFNPSTE